MTHYPSIDLPSIKKILWEEMRHDFVSIAPEFLTSEVLPCCVCGRLLPQRHFTLEHILPRQALAEDPPEIRSNPESSNNRRTRLTLLCNYSLKTKESTVSLGCNGWKGKQFDGYLCDIVVDKVPRRRGGKITTRHMIALSIASYLAMVSRYGYRIVFTTSGLMMRRQFFHPQSYIKDMPDACQGMVTGSRFTYPEIPSELWLTPFTFKVYPNLCLVTMRQAGINIPLSRDPDFPVSSSLRFLPSRYRLRPDFQTLFE